MRFLSAALVVPALCVSTIVGATTVNIDTETTETARAEFPVDGFGSVDLTADLSWTSVLETYAEERPVMSGVIDNMAVWVEGDVPTICTLVDLLDDVPEMCETGG